MTSVHRIHPLKYRSVWISDVHLGSRECKAEFLLDFLRSTECENLYLLGDIVDLWCMKKKGSLYWPQAHNNVIRTILGKAKHNTRVIYIPGNHDYEFREYDKLVFGNVEIHLDYIHVTADRRKLYLTHGDQFDSAVKCSRIAAYLGNHIYEFILHLDHHLNRYRMKRGYSYWSLSSFVKRKLKNAVEFIQRYEKAVAQDAAEREVDGVVCGHIHKEEIRNIDNILYCNTGDWVENCTVLVEKHDGSLHLLHWSDAQHTLKSCTQEPIRKIKKIA